MNTGKTGERAKPAFSFGSGLTALPALRQKRTVVWEDSPWFTGIFFSTIDSAEFLKGTLHAKCAAEVRNAREGEYGSGNLPRQARISVRQTGKVHGANVKIRTMRDRRKEVLHAGQRALLHSAAPGIGGVLSGPKGRGIREFLPVRRRPREILSWRRPQFPARTRRKRY